MTYGGANAHGEDPLASGLGAHQLHALARVGHFAVCARCCCQPRSCKQEHGHLPVTMKTDRRLMGSCTRGASERQRCTWGVRGALTLGRGAGRARASAKTARRHGSRSVPPRLESVALTYAFAAVSDFSFSSELFCTRTHALAHVNTAM